MNDNEDLPGELEQMIDNFDGDTHEYAKGIEDAWRYLTGREPEWVMLACPECNTLSPGWRSFPYPPQEWLDRHAAKGHHPFAAPGWCDQGAVVEEMHRRADELHAQKLAEVPF